MKKPKQGRPPLVTKRDHILAVRMTEKEHTAVSDAAKKLELSPSTFARVVVLKKVRG